MKRFHVHVGVEDLEQSIRFYSGLFGAAAHGAQDRLREMDGRGSAPQLRDLAARRPDRA